MPAIDIERDLLREAYDLVLEKWPDVILPGQKTFHIGGGCNMRMLNEMHDPIEEWALKAVFRPDLDLLISGVEHYVFVCIHNALKSLTSLRKADLDFEAFVSWFDSSPDYRVVSER